MKSLLKSIVILSVVSIVFSITAFQFGDVVKPVPKQNLEIVKNPIPIQMYDIRGIWTVKMTWDEPPTQEWTFTFKGKKSGGTYKGIQKAHGFELLGKYTVKGKKITFFQDPSTIDNSGPGTTYPINCTGTIKNKNSMNGKFKCGPDIGTWTAARRLILIPRPIIKKK